MSAVSIVTATPTTGRYAKLQNAATVLGVLRDRGGHGLPLERLYRQLFNPDLYLLAYGRLYSNHGAMTPGVDGETVDGMSQGKIERIIQALRQERYRFKPVRRVHIPKRNGKIRPLGLPSWSDKPVGEVIRLLLEAYYEPTFSDSSHGFRSRRGCHTALSKVAKKWTGTTWFIEGDISSGNPAVSTIRYGRRFVALACTATVKRHRRCVNGYAACRARDPHDPGFRRLYYVRYADDHLLGFTRPRAEAEQIKTRLAAFLRDDLKLELSPDKTLITHARTGAAKFLGYEITTQHSQSRRKVNGVIGLRVPREVIKAKCAPYFKHGKPERRTELISRDDLTIVSTYGAEYRGLVQYYLLAGDVWRLKRLCWAAETSMLKTPAAKHGSSVTKMARRYKATVDTPHGPRTCFQVTVERAGKKPLVARFGGIPLKRQNKAVLTDRQPVPVSTRRRELIFRLQAGRCELCEQRGTVEVHHVARLADLAGPGRPQLAWAQLMAQRRRKTLVVCRPCYGTIHARQPIHDTTE